MGLFIAEAWVFVIQDVWLYGDNNDQETDLKFKRGVTKHTRAN